MDLFYRKYGEGRPIIILHGLFGMSDNWATIGKQLAENNFSVYIPDQRNHGESPRSDDFNYEILSNDLNDFIVQHSLISPIIIGHSMGGKAAMHYAIGHEGSIHKLILVDIGIKQYSNGVKETMNALLATEIESKESRGEIEARLYELLHFKRVVQLMMKNVKRISDKRFDWKFNLAGIKKNFESMYEGLVSNEKYSSPVLFIRGGHSEYIKEEDIPGIKEIFPAAGFITIEGASHWVHADKPVEFFEVVREYLG